ncbi:amidohydrolase family protein [Mangrovicoccus algicola]|uniref:Amidohydrolase family protein n=1 Tax=Mangrovicoccus algicola TaxID=2771008 RepID=A0A8J7CVL6_9RHOB|nr:amidohydrolase family protein [Mangrovicoccus algicola]MBE3638879.1 amidohydrolase family protein [Mangrovicoccus algicola]
MTHPSPQQRSFIAKAGVMLEGLGPDGGMRLRHDVAIRVEDGVIAQIGPLPGLVEGHEQLPQFGGPGMVAMPGLVNAHHHFGVTPLMNGVPFAPLEFWLPQFRAKRQVGTRLDTLFSAIEMLESGVTATHHIASGLVGGREDWNRAADETLAAYDEIGMRVGYSAMLRDQNILHYDGDAAVLAAMPEAARAWFAARLHPTGGSVRAYAGFHDALRARHAANPAVRINYAPANLHWCSDALLEFVAGDARAAGAQVHMHLAETERQAAHARRRFGRSAVARLRDLGLLGPNVTLGHCNWLDPGDVEMLADCGCTVCHNASSGQRLGSGKADVPALRRGAVPVALGIDQSTIADDRDMLLEMKLAWALNRGTQLHETGPDAAAVIGMATETGAATLGFGGLAGRLECGMRADMVLLSRERLEHPYVDPRVPVAELILHRARPGAVAHVFVDGRQVVAGGRVITIDREAVFAGIRARLAAPWSDREREAAEMVAAAMPAIRRAHA